MQDEITKLKKDLRVEKMLHSRLKKKVGAGNGINYQTQWEDSQAEVVRLENELNASRRECGQLVKEQDPNVADNLADQLEAMEVQVYHLQQLIIHTAAVTEWKIQHS
jgi:hypothetical protein